MTIGVWPSKDPDEVDYRLFVWCSQSGLNDGSAADDGELQGATISSYTVTVPTGITKDSDNKNAISIKGASYGANTVVTVWLSGGTDGADYDILCQVVTSDGRTLERTMRLPVRAH